MSSKLLSREGADQVQAFVFRPIGTAPQTHTGAISASMPGAVRADSNDQTETTRLRAQVAQLEQTLQQTVAQQIPAARQMGQREGEAAGRAQAEATIKPVMERLSRSVQDLIEMKARMRKELEQEAVQLSLAIAKRILWRELSMDPSALHGLVQAAFERVSRQEITRVLVHPEHVAPVRDAINQLTTRSVEVVGDASREKGALFFETTRGALDASVDSQLKEIELGLADRLKWR